MSDLARELVETGLLQFGSFARGERMAPYQLHLELLPSYPDLLEQVTEAITARLSAVDHLLCTADAVPIGVAVGLRAHLPLVYSRGSDAPSVHDLVGAYDIGHKAALITTSIDDSARLQALIDGARRVGLDTREVIAVVDIESTPLDGMPFVALLRLADIVADLVARGLLPAGQGVAVRAWLARDVRG